MTTDHDGSPGEGESLETLIRRLAVRLTRIERLLVANHKEIHESMSDIQTTITADAAAIEALAAQLDAAKAAITAEVDSLKAANPTVNTSGLDKAVADLTTATAGVAALAPSAPAGASGATTPSPDPASGAGTTSAPNAGNPGVPAAPADPAPVAEVFYKHPSGPVTDPAEMAAWPVSGLAADDDGAVLYTHPAGAVTDPAWPVYTGPTHPVPAAGSPA